MKKFISSARQRYRSGGSSSVEPNQPPERDNSNLQLHASTSAVSLQQQQKMDRIAAENNQLKQLTQKLLNENVELKERARAHEADALRGGETWPSDAPSFEETQKLLQMVTSENEYLMQELSSLQAVLRRSKEEQLKSTEELTFRLDAVSLEKDTLQKQWHKLRCEHDELKSQCEYLEEENTRDDVVTVTDHQLAIDQCRTVLNELRDVYTKQLGEIAHKQNHDHLQLKQFALDIATITAELTATQQQLKHKTNELHSVRTANAELQTKLVATTDENKQLEEKLEQMIEALRNRAQN